MIMYVGKNASDCTQIYSCLGSLRSIYTGDIVSKIASDSCTSCFCLGSLRCLCWQYCRQKHKYLQPRLFLPGSLRCVYAIYVVGKTASDYCQSCVCLGSLMHVYAGGVAGKNTSYCCQSYFCLGSLRSIYTGDVVIKNASDCCQIYSCLGSLRSIYTGDIFGKNASDSFQSCFCLGSLRCLCWWCFGKTASYCCHGCSCLDSLRSIYTGNVVSKNASDSCQSCFWTGSLRCLRWRCCWQKCKLLLSWLFLPWFLMMCDNKYKTTMSVVAHHKEPRQEQLCWQSLAFLLTTLAV